MEQESQARIFGGYDNRFIGDVEKYQCAVCLLVLKHAMQTSCGHRFCKTCIDTVIGKSTMLRCPVDRQFSRLEQIFPDVAFRHEVLSLSVRCSHESCPWTGELNNYESHRRTCTMEDVACPFGCGTSTKRWEVDDHTKTCPRRDIDCQYCKCKIQFQSVETHLGECLKLPVACPLCDKDEILRENLDAHTDETTGTCPATVICCPYSGIGCTFSSRRCEMDGHMTDITAIANHLSTMSKTMIDFQTTAQDLRDEIARLNGRLESSTTSISRWDRRQEALKKEMHSRNVTGQLHWKIETRGGRTEHTSTQFYTGCPGYKVQLEMEIDHSRDGFVRFSLAILRGEYDDQVMWPFNALCYLTILDQKPGNQPQNQLLNFMLREVPRNRNGSRTDRLYKRAMPKLSNKEEIIGHSSRFIKNGCLFLEVSVVHCVYPMLEATSTTANLSPVFHAIGTGARPPATSTPILNLSSFLMQAQ